MIVAEGALAGRVAVVTGASSGIGLATANRLHDLGASVPALARRRETMQEGVGDRDIDLRPLDVSDLEATFAALDHERIDALILAAGTNVKDRVLEGLSPESWDALMRTNLDGVYHCVSAALPALRAAKGIVVIVGSVSGSWPDVSGPGYQATNARVLGLARGAALDALEAGPGVRFSVIAPGVVDTPILETRPAVPPPEDRPKMLQADDVAELCAYLAA